MRIQPAPERTEHLMTRKLTILFCALSICLLFTACAGTSNSSSVSSSTSSSSSSSSSAMSADTSALIADYSGKFEQKTYADADSGLSISYDLYLPEGYDASASYPMVVFIADSSCVGSDATKSLTQGRGALVWASSTWQTEHPCIVAVPTYPETILDDHSGYTTTEYVELTKRFIDFMSGEYAVDASRIYGTGQSMGCMTTLILAANNPDLYSACMFVDGQWDINALSGLETQKFVYFAAEDDTNAWNGMQELMESFKTNTVSYKYAQWNGTWSQSELTNAANELFTADDSRYFISWATGTIEAKSSGMGGKGGSSGGANSTAYHMASFDYAYYCNAVMEWLFTQTK